MSATSLRTFMEQIKGQEIENIDPGFEFGEDIRNEARALQDEMWKGADIDGRKHMSHRELTEAYRPRFIDALNQYKIVEVLVELQRDRGNKNIEDDNDNKDNDNDDDKKEDNKKISSRLSLLAPENIEMILSYLIYGQDGMQTSLCRASYLRQLLQNNENNINQSSEQFKIYLRKRPLLQWEINRGAYDVISTKSTDDAVVVHDGRLSRDGRRLSMCHRTYLTHCSFGSNITNQSVCKEIVQPIINRCNDSKNSTIIFFGQTGTGKTYTMNAALEYIAENFHKSNNSDSNGKSNCDDNDSNNTTTTTTTSDNNTEIIFYEIHGKKAFDLLNERNLIHLRSDAEGILHPRGALSIKSSTGKEFLETCHKALSYRQSKLTERNPISSRSHAIVQIKQCNTDGIITLVDLAGSERNYETLNMKGAGHRESADINTSLMSLKECFIGFHAQLERKRGVKTPTNTWAYKPTAKINFRGHLLTRVLKSCFVDPTHHTSLCVTASPTPIDLEHTVNSIDHTLKMQPDLFALSSSVLCEIPLINSEECKDLTSIPPSEWNADHLQYWLATYKNGRFAKLALPAGLTGAKLLMLGAGDLSKLFAGQMRSAREDDEGCSWIVEGEVTSEIGVEFWTAIHREEMLILNRKKALEKGEKSVLFA